MVKPVNSKFFTNENVKILISFHNGTGVVTGYIVRQIGTSRYVVTVDGTTMFTVQLAQTTAQAGTLTAGYGTIQFTTGAYIKVIRDKQAVTTEGAVVLWNPSVNLSALLSVVGDVTVGQILTANVVYETAPVSEVYQWFRDGVAIAAADDVTYTLVGADDGALITFVVTATYPGVRYTFTSPATAPVAP
jgi:hypothetical protein